MNNESEIARLGVELAELVKGCVNLSPPLDVVGNKADRIIALAAPPAEPLPWPGLKGKPQVYGHAEHGFYVLQSDQGVWTHHGPLCLTRAAAIAEWNKVVRAISGGVDEETRGLMLVYRDVANSQGWSTTTKRIDAWLARHPKGGGA